MIFKIIYSLIENLIVVIFNTNNSKIDQNQVSSIIAKRNFAINDKKICFIIRSISFYLIEVF